MASEELYGYSKEELQGKPIMRLLSMSGMADVQLEIYYNIVVQGLSLPMPGVQIPLRRKTGELVNSSVVIKKTRAPGAS